MPKDERGYDRRIRALDDDASWCAIQVFSAAGRDGRRGWIELAAGETFADVLMRLQTSEERLPPERAAEIADQLLELGLFAVSGDRVVVKARELASYDDEPTDVHLIDTPRIERELRERRSPPEDA